MSEVFLTGFNPTSISGLKEWFDASQTSSILSNSSGQVYQWNNLAGYANATQATASYQPYTGNVTVNGLNAMYYTATSFITTGSISFTSQYRTLFQVVQVTTLSGVASYAFYSGTQMSIFQILFPDFEVNNHPGGNRMATVNPSASGGFIACPSNIYRVPYLLDVYASSGVTGFFVNGSNCGALSPIAVFPIGTFTNAIGSNNTYGATPQPWYLCETLHYDADLTVAQRQLVEGYLAWKWGFQATLISTHPYYSVNPNKVTGFPAAIQSLVTPSFNTPLLIPGCAIWMDGADSSSTSMTLSGSTITSWKDKSGNGVTFSITGTPTLSNAVYNGLSSVYFNGSTNFYNTTFNMNLINHTFFIVVTETAGGNRGVLIFYITGTGTDDVYASNSLEFSSPEAGIEGNYGSQPYSNLTYGIYGDVSPTGGTFNFFKNGVSVISKTGLVAATSTGVCIGSRVYSGGFTYFMTGYVSEVIVYNTALSIDKRQQVEGYLANKWGLKSSLLSTHPYYSIAPTTTVPLAIGQAPLIAGQITTGTAKTFTYTGANQSYTVPGNTASLLIHMWGAGGGGGSLSRGGAGAYLTGVLTVVPGETLTIIVGQGGRGISQSAANSGTTSAYGGGGAVLTNGNGNSYGNGGGGGRSAIQRASADIVTVGAGGGTGCSSGPGYTTYFGGAGSYNGNGSDGGGYNTTQSGKGGTLTAGGAAGPNQASYNNNATPGSKNQGGSGDAWSGGGGSGYYGGGGASDNGGFGNGGGGGGSSYTANLVSIGGANSIDGYSAPGTSVSYYQSGVAVGAYVGSASTATNGGNGLVVVIPVSAAVPAAIQSILTPALTPLNVSGCQLWLDGADPAGTGTAPANGATVSTWKDKSGNGRDAAAGVAGTYSSAQKSITFSGTNYYNSPYTAAPTTETLFIVFNLTTNNAPFMISGAACGGRIAATYTNSGPFAGGANCYSWGAITTSVITTGSNTLGVVVTDGSSNYTSLHGALTLTGPTTGITYTSGVTTYIGAHSGPNYLTNGYICEVIAYNSVLSVLQRQKVEGYLGWKWGLQTNLPSAHPYFSASPTIPTTIAIAPPPTSQVITTFSYTGSYMTYTVPSNIFSLQAYAWGAGGGYQINSGIYAGGGALVTGTISVSPGEQLRIIVGKGGANGSNVNSNYFATGTDAQGAGGGGGGSGGQGGGRSAVQKYIGSTWTEVLTAGGGGGCAINAGDYGGNAYYTGTSQDAGNTYGQYTSAKGATQSAGGVGATITGRTPYNYPSNNGAAFVGGTALLNTDGQGGGGGGGGYYGGGGGGYNGAAETSGGGGGSSYYNPFFVTGFAGSNGNNITPVGASLSFYDGQAGLAQTTFARASGSNGLVAFVATVGLPFPFPATTTGGTITTTGSYRFHTFTTTGSSTFTTNKAITAQVLVVGGGGGGGDNVGGGGGAGAAVYSSVFSIPAGSYSLTVGAGGAVNASGSASTFRTLTAPGGGYGGTWRGGSGVSGGCGGGGAGDSGLGAAGTVGFAGGSSTGNISSGGGGGMGSAGSNAVSGQTVGGAGGLGATYTVGGVAYLVCGGGAGSSYRTTNPIVIAYGGSGIGGNGADSELGPNATAPTPNTGSGGGGGGGGTAGAAGIIVIAFIP
jgi:Glycine rich protein